LAALAWLLLVALAATLITRDRLRAHESTVASGAQLRLQALHDNVETHFRTLAELAQVLARQPAMVAFLEGTQAPKSANLNAEQRKALRESLLKQPPVVDMGRQLSDLVRSFRIRQAYVQDAHGTSLADSHQDEEVSTLGANFRTREYFIDAMERGSGFQFVMGSVSLKPGFNFTARIENARRHLGILVLKSDPESMRRLFTDTVGRILVVVDHNGVIVAGNRPQDLMHRLPQAPALSPHVDVPGVYRRMPAELDWQISGPATVNVDGQPYQAHSREMDGYPYQLWVLSPLANLASIELTGILGGVALVVMGWLSLWAGWRRVERTHAVEQARAEALEMTRALPLGLFRYRVSPSGQGRFSHIGPGAAKVFGAQLDELLKAPARLWGAGTQAASLPPTAPTEFPLELEGGSRWVSVNSAEATSPGGDKVFDGYWLDVTARKRAESRFDLAFEHAPNGFLFFHIEHGVLRCNPAAVQLYGYQTQEQLMGLKPWMPPLSPATGPGEPDPQAAAVELLNRCRASQQALRFEWTHQRADGRIFEAEVVLMSLSQEDPDLYFAILEDVTARKETAQALERARDAAEATARAKSAFLANMSHEIRTPMNAVIGMTHLALMEDPPEKVRGYVSKANQAATSLLTILNDVLDLSKIEAGHLELECVDFQVDQVLDEVVDVLALTADKKGVELLISAPADLPSHLMGDPTRLRQVFVNLGSNAVKFTEHGSVTLGLGVEERNDTDLVLHGWVRDTGIGLTAEQLSRLFTPFSQVDASTTRRHGGTGLGLTISRQLTERMGGRMWVESQPGQGSTFHFTARVQLPRQPAPMAPLRENWAGKRVLIVDDQPDAREVLRHMVDSMGLQAEVAASGEEALQKLEHADQAFEWLLLDWKMPGMDGLTLARHIQSRPIAQRPCILLVTAFDRAAALQAATEVSLAGVLTKPVTPSSLFDSLSRSGVALAPLAMAGPASGAETRTTAASPAENRGVRVPGRARPPDGATQASATLAGARILLVEDQPLNQELARELLERAGANVTVAQDGVEALDTLERDDDFDCVLMDCQMPRMDGYTATAHIRARPEWARLPIIAMTASALSSDREQALAAGMNDHVAKPLDIQQMFSTIQRWLQARRSAARRGS
jgi:PAS domain S-box-containing protein